MDLIRDLEATDAHWKDVENEIDGKDHYLDALGLHPLGIYQLLDRLLLEELVVDLIFCLFGNNASIIQIIKLFLLLPLGIGSYLLADDLHMEVYVEVLDFKFLFEAFRFLLVLHHNIFSDLVLDVQEVLETVNGLMLLFIVGEWWQLGTLKFYLKVTSRVIDL